VTVNARLVPPKGGAPILINISGSRTNLSDVVNRLVQKVIVGLKRGSTSPAWNPAEEAAQYFDEAKWAFKWGMLKEAQAACESSWALGDNTRKVAELRIRTYQEEGTPERNALVDLHPELRECTPDAAMLSPALRAIELYQRDFASFCTNGTRADTNWFDLGLDVLSHTSLLLRQFYFHPEARQPHEEQLAELRHSEREMAALIDTAPVYRNFVPSMHSLFIWGRNNFFSELNPALKHLEAGAGVFWQDTPERCVEIYRKYQRAGQMPNLREYFAHASPIGWNPNDESRGATLWRDFIGELCSSTNALTKVEGYFMKLADAEPGGQEEAAKTFLRVVLENTKPVVGAGLKDHLWHDFEHLLADPPRGFPGTAMNARIYREFDSFKKDFEKEEDAAMRSLRLDAMAGYLSNHFSTNNLVDYYAFENLFVRNLRYFIKTSPLYQRSDAVDLLPLLRRFKALLVERQQMPENKNRHEFGWTLKSVDSMITQFEAMVTMTGDSGSTANSSAQPPRNVAPVPAEAKPTITKQVALCFLGRPLPEARGFKCV
jgi:hypothetical protein